MMPSLIALFVVLVAWPFACVGQECLVNCTCSISKYFEKVLVCRNLSSVPDNLPTDIQRLDLAKNNIENITSGKFEGLTRLTFLDLSSSQIKYVSPGAFKGAIYVMIILLTNNKITYLRKGLVRDCSFLMYLDLSQNDVKVIEPGAFLGGYSLLYLLLVKNDIQVIQPGAFSGLTGLSMLDLTDNKITNINGETLQGMPYLESLSMGMNRIEKINEGVFNTTKYLQNLYLDDNLITDVDEEAFKENYHIILLRLRNNSITHFKKNIFQNLRKLKSLFISENKITIITADLFKGLSELTRLHLDNNHLTHLHERTFKHIPKINTITLHTNRFKSIPESMFANLTRLKYLSLQSNQITNIPNLEEKPLLQQLFFTNNKITSVPNMKLRTNTELINIFLGSNQVDRIYNRSFYGALKLKTITLSGNPLTVIEDGAFLSLPNLTMVSLVNTFITTPLVIWPLQPANISFVISQNTKTGNHDLGIRVESLEPLYLVQTLGYYCTRTLDPSSFINLNDGLNTDLVSYCYPCERGSYKPGGIAACKLCPPGGFYQDEMGYIGRKIYGMGCKQCPPGTYVKPKFAPGKSKTDCRSCPQGTYLKTFAKFRACSCMEGHYRLDRFGNCTICSKGYVCKNESIDLAAGFYWVWERKLHQDYESFKKDLLISDGSHKQRAFKGVISKAYSCPIAASCLGGRQSGCKQGHSGPLCAVCDKGYIQTLTECQLCPSIPWIIAQMALVAFGLTILAITILRERKKKVDNPSRSLTDIVLARLKIVIGFYQVSSATFDAFSYISWPAPVLIIIKYAKMVQVNLLQIAPLNCLNDAIKTDAYTQFLSSMSLTGAIIIFGILFHYFIKFYHGNTAGKSKNVTEERQMKVNQYEQKCYRCLFLILFITFPSTFTHVVQMLPDTCQKICSHDDYRCKSYLKADYSIECNTAKHDMYTVLSTTAMVYCIGFPLVLFMILRNGREMQRRHGESWLMSNSVILNSIRFLYENYSPTCWFWEIVELLRKIGFTFILVLMTAESRLSLGLTSIFSGLYSVLFALYKPINDSFEHWLQLASLMASSVNFTIGMLLKIPEDESSSDVKKTDALAITVLLMTANIAVVAIVAVKYLASILATLIILKKEPRCDMSCCLEVLQIAIDAQGEITDAYNGPTVTENPVFNDTVEDVTAYAGEEDEKEERKGVEGEPKKNEEKLEDEKETNERK